MVKTIFFSLHTSVVEDSVKKKAQVKGQEAEIARLLLERHQCLTLEAWDGVIATEAALSRLFQEREYTLRKIHRR